MVRDGIDIAIRTSVGLPETVVARRSAAWAARLRGAGYVEQHGLPAHPDELLAHPLITNSAAPVLNEWPFKCDGEKQL